MKTERRHELQHNVLADSLAHWIEAAKPYSRAALAAVIALVVIVFSWSYMSAQKSRSNAEGWQHYFDAFNSPDPRGVLSDTAETFAGTQVGDWSRLVLADLQLDQGTSRLFVEKKDGRDELKQAAEKYRSVIGDTQEPMLLQRATFGLARAHEALGSLAEARKEYRSISEKWPGSPYAEAATARAKDLDEPDTKSFYDWFAKYEPPRPMSREPGTPGERPDFMKDPLEGGGLKLPAAIDDKTPLPKFGEPSQSSPAGEESAPEENPAAEPSAEKPAEETSAESPSGDNKPESQPQ